MCINDVLWLPISPLLKYPWPFFPPRRSIGDNLWAEVFFSANYAFRPPFSTGVRWVKLIRGIFSSEWACLRVINETASPAFPNFDSNPQFTRTPTDGESVGRQLTSSGFFLLLGHSPPLIFFVQFYLSKKKNPPFSFFDLCGRSTKQTDRQERRRESNKIDTSVFLIYISQIPLFIPSLLQYSSSLISPTLTPSHLPRRHNEDKHEPY